MAILDAKGVEVDSEKLESSRLKHEARYWLRRGNFNLIEAKTTVRELEKGCNYQNMLLAEIDRQHALWVGRRENKHDKELKNG